MPKHLFLPAALLVLVAAGCGKKTEAKAELERVADSLAKSEAQQPAAPPSAEAPAAQVSVQPDATPAPAATPAQEVRQALTAYKTGQLEDAVTRLQKLKATPTLTPQQRMQLQDSIAAVMNEIYDMASKGDMRAIQAVRQYEEMQNRRR